MIYLNDNYKNCGWFMFDGKFILIIGGIGLFGYKYIENLLLCYNFKCLIIYLCDELK